MTMNALHESRIWEQYLEDEEPGPEGLERLFSEAGYSIDYNIEDKVSMDTKYWKVFESLPRGEFSVDEVCRAMNSDGPPRKGRVESISLDEQPSNVRKWVHDTLYRLHSKGLVERVGDDWGMTSRGEEVLDRSFDYPRLVEKVD